MKLWLSVIFISLFLLPFSASSYEYPMFGESQQACFSSAMVGMDSVINARLQVPAEHALDLSRVARTSEKNEPTYDSHILNIVLNAYLWKESPHNYAVKVFYDCAVRASYQKQASVN